MGLFGKVHLGAKVVFQPVNHDLAIGAVAFHCLGVRIEPVFM